MGVDLDGWEDLLISNGQQRAARDMDVSDQLQRMRAERKMSDAEIFQARRMFPRLATPNLAFRKRHDLTFEEAAGQWGFDLPGVSQGMACADLDNDGDLDVVINNFDDAASYPQKSNQRAPSGSAVEGHPPNTAGIGAKIKVLGGPVAQSQEILCGGRYLSADDPMRVFAAWHATNEFQIEVAWRSGKKSVVRQAKANFIYEIDEVGADEIRNPQSAIQRPKSRTPKCGRVVTLESPVSSHQLPVTSPPRRPSSRT